MKLQIKNFRCHENKTLTIPDKGLVLLSGASGSGKSSILNAIVHAFYGKIRKPYTFGKNTCRVELEWKNLCIERINKPNRLIVKKENELYEDQVAQNVIQDTFHMDYEQFLLSSYVSQKNTNSILSLSHLEQLEKIKTITMSGNSHGQFLDVLKQKLNSLKNDILVYETSISQYKEQQESYRFQEIDKEELPFDMCSNLEEQQKHIQEFIDQYKQINNRIDLSNQSIQSIIQKRDSIKNSLSQIDKIQFEIKHLEDVVKDTIPQNINIDNMEHEKNTLQKNKHQINEIYNYLECLQHLQRLISNKEYYEKELKEKKEKEMADIEKKLWKKNGKIFTKQQIQEKIDHMEDCKLQYKKYNQQMELLKKLEKEIKQVGISVNQDISLSQLKKIINDIENKINDLEKDIHELNQEILEKKQCITEQKLIRTIYKCPKCQQNLLIKTNHQEGSGYSLQCYHNQTIKQDISGIQQKINQCKKDKQEKEDCLAQCKNIIYQLKNIEMIELDKTIDYTTIDKKIKQYKNYIQTNMELDVRYKELQKDHDSTFSLQKDINKLHQKKNKMKDAIDNNVIEKYSIDMHDDMNDVNEMDSIKQYIKNIIKNIDIEIHDIQKSQEDYDCKNKKVNECQKKIECYKKKLISYEGIEKEYEEIEQLYQEKTKELNDLYTEKEYYVKYIDKVENYKSYVENQVEYKKIQCKINEKQKLLDNSRQRYNGCAILKERYTMAEMMAVEKAMSLLNQYTKIYLDTFFENNPLTANLTYTYKEKRINSFKIHTNIQYKGNEYDTIQQLSGGEIDRVNLASICGMNMMLDSPLLILDESLSSLDSETNTEILTFLKEYAKHKLILVCSHEAVQGIFDTVIELD